MFRQTPPSSLYWLGDLCVHMCRHCRTATAKLKFPISQKVKTLFHSPKCPTSHHHHHRLDSTWTQMFTKKSLTHWYTRVYSLSEEILFMSLCMLLLGPNCCYVYGIVTNSSFELCVMLSVIFSACLEQEEEEKRERKKRSLVVDESRVEWNRVESSRVVGVRLLCLSASSSRTLKRFYCTPSGGGGSLQRE